MIVDLGVLTTAISKVKTLASDIKNAPNVMFVFEEGTLDVCFSDGQRSLIEKISGQMEDDDICESAIVDLKSFCENLDGCQPTGNIKTGPFHIWVDGTDALQLSTYKYYEKISTYDDGEVEYEPDENGNLVAKVIEKKVSTIEPRMKYLQVDSTKRTALISRADYAGIFEGDEWDEWDTSELKNVLSKLCKEDAKICYMSKKQRAGFVVNLASVTFIPCDSIDKFGFTVSGRVARNLVDILGKISDEKVYVTTIESRYCKIIGSTVGIIFEMAPSGRTELVQLAGYIEKEYADYKIAFNRAGFNDVIKYALSIDNNNETQIDFVKTGENLELKMQRGSGASGKSVLAIEAETFRDDNDDISDLKLNMNLKILSNLISNCDGEFVVIEIEVEEKGKFVRIVDSRQDAEGNMVTTAAHYTICK